MAGFITTDTDNKDPIGKFYKNLILGLKYCIIYTVDANLTEF